MACVCLHITRSCHLRGDCTIVQRVGCSIFRFHSSRFYLPRFPTFSKLSIYLLSRFQRHSMATINGDTGVPDRTDVSQLSFHEQYAATQIRNNVGEIQNDIPALVRTVPYSYVHLSRLANVAQPEASPNSLTAINDSLFDGEDLDPEFKVLVTCYSVYMLRSRCSLPHRLLALVQLDSSLGS